MVAKEGSFSRAAERLYRTQPAISLAIRKLEDSLGQPLFIRGARPVRLTDAGTLLKDYAERLINLRDEAKKGLSELEGLKRGELSLGVNESSIHALLPALAQFREKHPGVQVRVHRMLSRDIPHEVLNYRLDLGAISYAPRDAQLLPPVIPTDHPSISSRKSVKSMSPSSATKTSSPTASNPPFAAASSSCLPEIAPPSTCPSKCPPSKASSASCKWAWAWPSFRGCAFIGKSNTAG